MTIKQLKNHVDGRFDRLERTKADRVELGQLERRFNKRLKGFEARIRRHFDIVGESLVDRINDVVDLVKQNGVLLEQVNERTKLHSDVLSEHEARIRDLEPRAGA